MSSPTKSNSAFFNKFSEYRYNGELSVAQNFGALAHHHEWCVGSVVWRRNWLSCFSRQYTDDQNPYEFVTNTSDLFCTRTFQVYKVSETPQFMKGGKPTFYSTTKNSPRSSATATDDWLDYFSWDDESSETTR